MFVAFHAVIQNHDCINPIRHYQNDPTQRLREFRFYNSYQIITITQLIDLFILPSLSSNDQGEGA